jgi:nitroreductase
VTSTTAADLTPLLRDRWSPRSFDPAHEIGDDELRLLLRAAQWSPSAGNSQPWVFLVARRGDESHLKLVEALSRGNVGWVPQASVVLVTVAHTGTGDEPDAPSYSDYADYDLGQAVAHLTVQASALGLDVHQFAGFDHAALTEAFDVPSYFTVKTGIAIGRHLEPEDEGLRQWESRERTRRDLDEFVFARKWGEPWA